MRSESAAVSRDLPMPGSPEISTTRPSPLFACCQRRDQQLDFLVTTDERRLPRAQRLEPANIAALAEHPPRRVAAPQIRQALAVRDLRDRTARRSAAVCSQR